VAKAGPFSRPVSARLKPCPFKAILSAMRNPNAIALANSPPLAQQFPPPEHNTLKG
jgi:hypothetical protein